MNNNFDQFWLSATSVSLTERERADIQMRVQKNMTSIKAVRKAMNNTALSSQEKDAFRLVLETHMDDHPLQRRSTILAFVHSLYSTRFLSGCMAGVLLFTGGTASASEASVPGDMLYPVKVDVLEPLRERFVFGEDAKTRWWGIRVERRLGEINALIERGNVNEEFVAMLEQRIDDHMKKIEQKMEHAPEDIEVQNITERMRVLMQNHAARLNYMQNRDVQTERMEHLRQFLQEKKGHLEQRKRPPQSQRMLERMENRTQNMGNRSMPKGPNQQLASPRRGE